jgi:UDP:flavonoid glycosyltransferase YjiC (YdhE family)
VENLGCGLVLKNLFDHTAATEKLRRLLDSQEIAHACRTVRDRMTPGPTACSRAADAIEEVSSSVRAARHAPLPSIRKIAS